MSRLLTVTRRYSLPALHSLGNPEWSPRENLECFGACSRPHGHEYQIEVTVGGEPDPDSGLLMSREDIDEIVSRALLEPLQGQDLSRHFHQTTGEALALEFFRRLQPEFPAAVRLHRVTVHETAKNFFTHQPG